MTNLEKLKEKLEKEHDNVLQPMLKWYLLLILNWGKEIESEEYLLAWEKSGY